jgi:hypothetical protein
MKKLKILLIVLVLLIGAGYTSLHILVKDYNPDYSLDLKIKQGKSNQIKAGFAAISINPEIIDTWNDENNNAKYEPNKGDSYNDINGNGEFDAVWVAGFHNRRPAQGLHDSLWARTMVVDDGTSRIALVSIDAVGLMHDDILEIRERLPEELNVDYCMVASTHVHEAPDMMGIWGGSFLKNGVDPVYREKVLKNAVASVTKAVQSLQPVSLYFSKDEESAKNLVLDTRKPVVLDAQMLLIRAKSIDNGETIGSLVAWANHPETVWSKNLLITSDFPHYLRTYIEEGVPGNDSIVVPGIGGTCVYFNGAVGGLITTHPRLAITDSISGKKYKEPGFEKVQALGSNLALIALNSLDNPTDSISEASIQLVAKSFNLPLDNLMFKVAGLLGVIKRSVPAMWETRTEMAAIQIGPATILTIPGEIYPEIVNGGIEAPEGQDYKIEPLEIPPLRSMMKGKYKFVFGLANDEIGYIIPKSEWDNKKPYIYGPDTDVYGEENSMGPETASVIHSKAKELLEELN